MRTSGDTPKAAIAAVELCMASSLMCPCSQSMIMPYKFLSDRELQRSRDVALTSRPVCATICAERKDGSPKKVIIGFEPARKALSRRDCESCPVQVVAQG